MPDPTSRLKAESPKVEKFGTFLGVYTPSVLTILGLIMYLRFGWVVGNVGLPLTFLIVLLASSVTMITALSASAIATNMRVGVGGEYYMVAHSLGLEFGGAIGIPLYLCRTLSITFYSYGLAETIVPLLPAGLGPSPERTVQLIAAITVIGITAVSAKIWLRDSLDRHGRAETDVSPARRRDLQHHRGKRKLQNAADARRCRRRDHPRHLQAIEHERRHSQTKGATLR